MAIPPDPLAALISYLKADPDVASLVGSRVFGAALPKEEAAHMPRLAVVVQDAGGFGSRGKSPQYNARMDIRTYGSTSVKAKQLQLACHEALRKLERYAAPNGALLYSASMDTGSFYLTEPDVHWPFYYSTWSIATNYQKVSF